MLDDIVHLVDDEPAVREAMIDLIESFGMRVVSYGSAAEFIAGPMPDSTACLVLDVALPGMSGLELQRQLAGGSHPPIVFISGHGDVPSSVRAMKAGAIDFLQKPLDDEDLLAAIQTALARDRESRRSNAELRELRRRYALLTPREREVLPLIISGQLNKQAAADLGISEVTYQIHRSQVMRKLAAGSLCGLVRIATKLGIGLSVDAEAIRTTPFPAGQSVTTKRRQPAAMRNVQCPIQSPSSPAVPPASARR